MILKFTTELLSKRNLLLLPPVLLLMQFRCQKDEMPANAEAFNFKLSASYNHTTSTLKVNDTLKIHIQLPDTISAKNQLNQVRTEKTEILNEATFAYFLHTIDSVDKQTHALSLSKPEHNLFDNFEVSIANGQLLSNIYNIAFATNAKPYSVTLNLVLKRRGVFFFYYYPGKFFINQTFKGNFIISQPADRHLQMVSNSTAYPNFLKDAEELQKTGIETYAFKVE